MTIYRAWSDMQQLLGDLMTREWARRGGRGSPTRTRPPPRSTGSSATSSAPSRTLRENELFLRIVELDPELLLPYLLARRGRSQDAILAMAEAAIRSGQAAGTVRDGNPVAIARGLLLAAHGFVLSAHTMVDDRRHRGRARRRADRPAHPGAAP